jgi:hypothetical protein
MSVNREPAFGMVSRKQEPEDSERDRLAVELINRLATCLVLYLSEMCVTQALPRIGITSSHVFPGAVSARKTKHVTGVTGRNGPDELKGFPRSCHGENTERGPIGAAP